MEINVLGAGTSLKFYPPSHFEGKINIGCNTVIEQYYKILSYYCVVDIGKNTHWITCALKNLKPSQIWYWKGLDMEARGVTADNVTLFDLADDWYEGRPADLKLGRGFTVAYCCINLAYLLGATKINLYGLDFQLSENKMSHFNSWQVLTEESQKQYIMQFGKMSHKVGQAVSWLRNKGVEVASYGKWKP